MNQFPSPDQQPSLNPGAIPGLPSRAFPRDGSQTVVQSDYAVESPASDLPSGGLLEYWRIIQRRKGTVILVSLLGLIAGFLYTVPQTPIYQARTVIEIQGLNEDFLHMRDVNPNAANSAGWDPTIDLQTQVHILQSRALIASVAKKLSADTRPLAPVSSRLDAWRAILHLPGPKPVSARESLIAGAAGGLRIRNQQNTRLIEILCDSTNPQMAADFANTLSTEFIEQNLNARWQTTQHTGEWLARQMEDIKIKLEQSEEALQAYARATNLVITDEKENAADLKLKQLQEELSKAQDERITRQSRYELAARASADSLGEVLDDQSLQDVQGKLTDLHRQLAELTATFTADHPRVQKVQAQISSLEAVRSQARLNILGRIRNDFESAERREKLLATDYAAIAKVVSQQADKVSHYNILKREVDTNRQVYDSMLQRVKEAGIASALRASNISVVDPAVTPGAPYKPSLTNNTIIGLLSGLFFGVVLVVFLDRADRTIQEPGDAAFYLGVPELGIVPSASADPNRSSGVLPFMPQQAASSRSMALVSLQSTPSAMAESFRATLTSILFSGEEGKYPRVIVISSAAPKEGKTTLSTNLAVAVAAIHKRVLLIDADIRRPSIHRFFDFKNDVGLVDLLRSPQPIQAPLNGHARKTDILNLSVLTSGRPASGDPTLFHSARLGEIINLVREEYDMVVIDTPPMLNMSDARIIARHADGVVLVARANKTSRDSIKDAYRRFVSDGTRLLGTVLNDWNPKKSSRYGYYRYYDKYKHYYGSSKSKVG